MSEEQMLQIEDHVINPRLQSSGCLARHCRLRKISVLFHLLDRHRGIGVVLETAVVEAGQELHALGQRLRLRQDSPNLVQRDILETEQTVLDAQQLLTDNR